MYFFLSEIIQNVHHTKYCLLVETVAFFICPCEYVTIKKNLIANYIFTPPLAARI